MADKLSDEAVSDGIAGTPWRREGDTIVHDLEFPDFQAAIAYVNLVADAAEAANHHPDILLHGWNKVRLVLHTHSVGGLTEADLAMARRLDAVPRP